MRTDNSVSILGHRLRQRTCLGVVVGRCEGTAEEHVAKANAVFAVGSKRNGKS